MGDFDAWSPRSDAEQLYELLDTPTKDLKSYHSDYRLPVWYINDSTDWFVTHLLKK